MPKQVAPNIALSELTYDKGKVLGEGGYGIVYPGRWKHGGEVAIKQIKGTLTQKAKDEFIEEAGVMANLNSPYVVRLFGVWF